MRVSFSGGYGQAFLFLFLILFLVSLLSCDRASEELPVDPPVTYPLSREYIGYGVVNVSFTHLLSEPDPGGISQGYLRRGTVVRIIERRQVAKQGNSESWVLAEGNYTANPSLGWLNESTVEIYDNESRAKTASETMSL